MTLYELLDLIQINSLAVVILSLLAYFIIIMKRDGFVVVLCASSILSIAHLFYDAALMEMAKDESSRVLVRDLWYLGFAASNFAFVFICYKLLDALSIKPNRVTSFYLNCYVFLGFIQLVRYADRILLETDLLGQAYQLSIPAINASMVIVSSGYVTYAIGWKIKRRFFLV
jgi:hypothetical protein